MTHVGKKSIPASHIKPWPDKVDYYHSKVSSSVYDKTGPWKYSSMLDSSQNKQIVWSGLLGKEHRTRKSLYHTESPCSTHTLNAGCSSDPCISKNSGAVEMEKLQNRAPKITEWVQQFLHATTEQVRSLQPRIKEDYVGYGGTRWIQWERPTPWAVLEERGTAISLLTPPSSTRT